MSIAVPDRCILAESNQLIEYSSPSNSQTEALKQKANALSLCHAAYIDWPFLVGVACQTKKSSFSRACSTHKRLMEFSRCSQSAKSINVQQET